jgi:Ala-tRNA(Pro) deacylase
MPGKKLKTYLDENNVRYVTIKHSSAYTSQEIASSAHISGKEFAKTVIVNKGEKLIMAVLPASYQVDFDQLKRSLGNENVTLAGEAEFKYHFPDCETGAMPPFGNLYNLEVYVAETLAGNEEISFNAGTHTELIKMSYADFERLVKPGTLRFSWKTVPLPDDPAERWEEDY